MKSLLDEFLCDFPGLPLYFRGDSGFASPDLYEVLEDKNCRYAIRLKENAKLRELAEEAKWRTSSKKEKPTLTLPV